MDWWPTSGPDRKIEHSVSDCRPHYEPEWGNRWRLGTWLRGARRVRNRRIRRRRGQGLCGRCDDSHLSLWGAKAQGWSERGKPFTTEWPIEQNPEAARDWQGFASRIFGRV